MSASTAMKAESIASAYTKAAIAMQLANLPYSHTSTTITKIQKSKNLGSKPTHPNALQSTSFPIPSPPNLFNLAR
jgi:hypothetical protein